MEKNYLLITLKISLNLLAKYSRLTHNLNHSVELYLNWYEEQTDNEYNVIYTCVYGSSDFTKSSLNPSK